MSTMTLRSDRSHHEKMDHNTTKTMITIGHEHDGGTTVDVNIFKAIGLYQLLRPFDDSVSGNRLISVFLAILYLIIGSQCMQVVGLYLASSDLHLFLMMTMVSTNALISTFKMCLIVINREKLWTLLDVTRYCFTSCSRRDPSRLLQCRNQVSAWLRTFIAFEIITCILWVVSPIYTDEYLPMFKFDGTVGYYRTSVFNLWYPVSESVYNWLPVWVSIYVTEVFIATADVYNWTLFDCFVLTMCSTLDAHFDTIFDAYEKLGHHHQSPSPQSHYSDHRIENNEMESDYYDELILHIMDTKKLIKSYIEFVDVIRPVVIIQIMISSFSMISLIFCTIQTYLMGQSMLSAPTLRLIFAYMSFTLQLFIYCYALNRVETTKSAINFGLYCCNWTERDLKFKKTLLKAIEINNAHKLKIKLSPYSIVNLEMFARMVKTSFSIVSVLLNVRSKI